MSDYVGGDYKCDENNNVTGCKFLKDVITFYTFIQTEDCDSNSEEGDNWSFAALNLGRRIISSNHCLTLFLVSLNEEVGSRITFHYLHILFGEQQHISLYVRVNQDNQHHCRSE